MSQLHGKNIIWMSLYAKSKILNIDDVFVNALTREMILPGFYDTGSRITKDISRLTEPRIPDIRNIYVSLLLRISQILSIWDARGTYNRIGI
jgi:hypothetical protein